MSSLESMLRCLDLATQVKPERATVLLLAKALAEQVGFGLGQYRPIVVARTLEEQSRVVDALQASVYPGLVGADFEFTHANRRIYSKDNLEAHLQRLWAEPLEVQESMVTQGKWPRLRNPHWPTNIPMFRDQRLFKDRRGRPRFGPVLRSIQLASVEGFTAVIDLVNDVAEYQLHDRVADLLLDPAILKAFFDPSQDRKALGLSFRNAQPLDLSNSPSFGPDQKWSAEQYAQIGWMNVQAKTHPRQSLANSLQTFAAEDAVLDGLREMKQQFDKVFNTPFAMVRPLERFGELGFGEPVQKDPELDSKWVTYGAMDANSALYLGLIQLLLASNAIEEGPNVQHQLAKLHTFANSHVRAREYTAKGCCDPSITPQQQTLTARRNIVRAIGPYWPGERLASQYSRDRLPWNWPYPEYPTVDLVQGMMGQVDWRL